VTTYSTLNNNNNNHASHMREFTVVHLGQSRHSCPYSNGRPINLHWWWWWRKTS